MKAGSYYGQVTRTNISDESFYGHCEHCHATICVGEVLYTHDATELDFCSPKCLTKGIDDRIMDAELTRLSGGAL